MQSRLTTGALVLAVLGTVGGLALAQGGYFPRAAGATSVLVLWAIAFGLLLVPGVRLSRLALTMAGGLGALTAWTALSLIWSLDPAQTVIEAERGLAYLAVLAGLLLFLRPRSVDGVLAALAAACTLVSLYALAGRLVTGETADPLEWPIGYSGSLGLLAAMGALLALGMAARAAAPIVRGLAGMALVPLAATVALSGSRTAYLALAIGLAVAVALGPERRLLLAAAALLPAPALAAWAAAGNAGLLLAVLLVLLAAASGLLASGRMSLRPAPVVAVLALAATTVGWGAAAPGAEPESPAGPAVQAFDARRAADSLEVRRELWGVALRTVREEPLLGAGAGGFARAWYEQRRDTGPARDAHSLYLETLSELGLVGTGLLLLVLAVPLVAAVRARRGPLVPAAFGAYVAYLVHAGIHWDWEMPALTLAALICGAALVAAAGGPARAWRLGAWPRALAVGAVLSLSALAFAGVVGHAALARSEAAARAGIPRDAADQARTAARWQPWSGEPWRLLGEALLAEGAVAHARASFLTGLRRDPGSWRLWADLSRATRGEHRRLAAARAERLYPGWRDVDARAATL